MTSPKTIVFKSTIGKFDGNLWHYHIAVPVKYVQDFLENKRIVCTLNQHTTFQAALMPMGDGNYFININKKLRENLKLNEGDKVEVMLDLDNSEYGLPMPDEFAELLQQDEEGNQVFHSLTPGKQRSLIYIAGNVKNPDLRIKRGIAILEHLKATGGKIDFKKLNQLMRA
jgi:bifunctional DNA-binding transcriptional regulator/antitoxin component of YhaV-PrlF toxin-antitoxin module